MITEVLYKQTLSYFPSGVTVLSAYDADGNINGLTVSAFSALSLNPPLILACPAYGTNSYRVVSSAEYFSINILAADQVDVAYGFAKRGAEKAAAISQMALSKGEKGTPILAGAVASLECRRWQEYAGGDHAILIGEIERIVLDSSKTPMIYCQGQMKAW